MGLPLEPPPPPPPAPISLATVGLNAPIPPPPAPPAAPLVAGGVAQQPQQPQQQPWQQSPPQSPAQSPVSQFAPPPAQQPQYQSNYYQQLPVQPEGPPQEPPTTSIPSNLKSNIGGACYGTMHVQKVSSKSKLQPRVCFITKYFLFLADDSGRLARAAYLHEISEIKYDKGCRAFLVIMRPSCGEPSMILTQAHPRFPSSSLAFVQTIAKVADYIAGHHIRISHLAPSDLATSSIEGLCRKTNRYRDPKQKLDHLRRVGLQAVVPRPPPRSYQPPPLAQPIALPAPPPEQVYEPAPSMARASSAFAQPQKERNAEDDELSEEEAAARLASMLPARAVDSESDGSCDTEEEEALRRRLRRGRGRPQAQSQRSILKRPGSGRGLGSVRDELVDGAYEKGWRDGAAQRGGASQHGGSQSTRAASWVRDERKKFWKQFVRDYNELDQQWRDQSTASVLGAPAGARGSDGSLTDLLSYNGSHYGSFAASSSPRNSYEAAAAYSPTASPRGSPRASPRASPRHAPQADRSSFSMQFV